MSDLGFTHIFEPGVDGGTLLLLHGTGGDEHDLVALGRRLAPASALLSPRGKVLEGNAPRFFRRLAVGQLDIPDLLVRTGELAAFVDAAAERYELDRERIIALGFSNGANIAVSLLLRHAPLLRGAALLRPMLPYEPTEAPNLDGVDVLVDSGAYDPYSPPEMSARLVQVLRAAGARVTAHVEPGAGHGLTQNDIALTARWMAAATAPVAS